MERALYSHHVVYNVDYTADLNIAFSSKEAIKVAFPQVNVGFPTSGPRDEAIINLDVVVETKIGDDRFRKLSLSIRYFFKLEGDTENINEQFVMDEGYDVVMSLTQSLIKSTSEIGGNIPIIVKDLHPELLKE
ncbi:hypothetical protein [Fructobacillus tropaeoli]|uniref:hypothetical protein n=1 Tax=Fructobacillus tropaeoli TaxID=709323 RepID=UPI002D824071|nr:unnamed protein product [Fructobacillus tropaeoli]